MTGGVGDAIKKEIKKKIMKGAFCVLSWLATCDRLGVKGGRVGGATSGLSLFTLQKKIQRTDGMVDLS